MNFGMDMIMYVVCIHMKQKPAENETTTTKCTEF